MVKKQEQYTYRYPHPSVTADAVLFGYGSLESDKDDELHVLLIERGIEPFKGMMALPGGFLNLVEEEGRPEDEDMEACVRRELLEETAIDVPFMEQFGVFSKKDRDPRVDPISGLKERVITVAFYGFVRMQEFKQVKGGDDANAAKWVPLSTALNETPLAFDHHAIIAKAIEKLREDIHFKPIAFNIVDSEFTIDQLRKVYEAVLNIELDRGNFRKKILTLGYVKDTGKRNTGNAHRSPFLYEFDLEAYNRTKDYRSDSDYNSKRQIGKRLEF